MPWRNIGDVKVNLHTLTSALDVGEWLSCSSCFTSSTHWIGSWLGPRASLDMMEERKLGE